MNRPTWDEVCLGVATEVGRRSTCPRARAYGGLGALLVERASHRFLGVGYCGSLPGQPHCTDPGVGCALRDGGCTRTVHAEMNALLYARPFDGPKILYSSVSPCIKCLQHAITVGVQEVVFAEEYREIKMQLALVEAHGVIWRQVEHGRHLLPFDALGLVEKVLLFGARKHSPFGWKRLEAALPRLDHKITSHRTARAEGVRIDAESRLPHLAHLIVNALFLLSHDEGIDDVEGVR